MFPVQELPRVDFHQRLVAEGHWPEQGGVVTIVASLSFMDREDGDRVTEWRAYVMAFGTLHGDAWGVQRIELTAKAGMKLPEAVARSIFPHVYGFYNE